MTDFNRREILAAGAATVALTAGGFSDVLAAPSTAVPKLDPMSLVDPELRPILEQVLKNLGPVKTGPGHLADARKNWSFEKPAPTPSYELRTIPGSKGAPDVRICLINQSSSGVPKAAIIHTHGGGFIGGVLESVIPGMQHVAQEHDCVVVSVDYRLAPEIHFPGSLEDNYAALKWVYQSADALGVVPSRIALMGESAGGGHAAMLAIAARDRGEVPLTGQILTYPMLDDRTGSSRHVPPYIGAFMWLPESNRYGWSSLLGVPAGSRVVPAGSVPARVQNLTSLPPTFIGVGSVDLFVDEDIEYARRLIAAGVPTELLVVPGAFHAFDGMAPASTAALQLKAARDTFIRKVLAEDAAT